LIEIGLFFLYTRYHFCSWISPPCEYGKVMEKGWKSGGTGVQSKGVFASIDQMFNCRWRFTSRIEVDAMKSPSGTLVEPLSKRERAILLHLAEDKSNREIATLEVLSLNSVKWYIQQIYGKLGVNRRREAIERARSLGLLPPLGPVAPPETTAAEARPSTLPTGTVTFLFTDIEGSIPLWEREPEKMAVALQLHNTALRQAIEANGGIVFKTVGDAFQAAFPTAPQALKAAIEGQRLLQAADWNELGPLKVRMGLHTGEAALDPGGDEYAVCHAKNRVARIMSVAHGGQVLLSAETYELCDHQLPLEVSLKDLGEYRLKGMATLEHLYQVCAPGMPQDFPPLTTGIIHLHNLPTQLSSFVGREREIDEVIGLLEKHRLVTLTGSGGTGKTRLSLQVAEKLLDQFTNGVWFVELAPLADPTLIPSTVATLFGLRQAGGRPLADILSDFFRSKRLLLILDNCEHLIQEAAQFANDVLRTSPEVKVLTTSRESLGLVGETIYLVPSLTTPEPLHMPDIQSLAQFEAVRLFTERACAVLPPFALTESNAPAVAQICKRLDGIPLAIELAAARVKVLSAEQIVTHLDDRFRLLTGGSRTALPRHQTLHALIDWSHELLSDAERVLFCRLSVFRGGWRLEATEAVCPCEKPAEIELLDLLSGLVNKSMIFSTNEVGGTNRFGMLETMRQYAQEKLVAAGEAESMRDRHLAYYLALTERIEPELRGRTQQARLAQLEEELDNLRAALSWALTTNPEAELRLASSLMWFWHIHPRQMEGLDWLGKGLDRAQSPSNPNGTPINPVVRAKALAAAGVMHASEIQWKSAEAEMEESLSIYRELGADGKAGVAFALEWLGWNECIQGNYEQGGALLRQALDLARQVKVPFPIGECLFMLGILLNVTEPGSLEARQYMEEALAILLEIEDLDGIATTYRFMGLMAMTARELEQAKLLFEQSLSLYQQVGNREAISGIYIDLGKIAQFQGNFSIAIEHYQSGVAIERDIGNPAALGDGLYYLGWGARSNGDHKMAKHYWEEALLNYRKTDNLKAVVAVLLALALLAWNDGDIALTSQKLSEVSATGLDLTEPNWAMAASVLKCCLARASGDEQIAVNFLKEALILSKKLDPHDTASLLNISAQLNARKQPEQAARLFGAAEHLGGSASPDSLNLLEQSWRETALRDLKSTLGEQRMADLWAEGQTITLDAAVTLALEEAGNREA
jgi:predicted ATPase/class 3 adenylate cyclase